MADADRHRASRMDWKTRRRVSAMCGAAHLAVLNAPVGPKMLDVAELRERMAKLEGALEGFLAGRRDRDAA